MWLQQLLLAMTCAFALTTVHPLALPQSNAMSETEPSRPLDYNENPEGLPKHFHEPGYSILAAHYDSRYFKGENTYEERRQIQVHMLRAYFQFFADNSIETWIAHGTLLGWWWNGKVGRFQSLGCKSMADPSCRSYHGIGISIPRFPTPLFAIWAHIII